jgi:hypothetical protein
MGVMVLVLAFAAAATAQEAPPAETLKRLEAASKMMETWQGTFLLTTRATISKTNGSDPEHDVSVLRMTGGDGGPRVTEVVSATRDGKDVSAKTRSDVDKGQAKHDKERAKKPAAKDDDGDGGVSLDLPGPDNVGTFTFAAVRGADGDCGVAFAPAKKHAGDEGLTTGELHWSCTTLDPLWVTARPAKNPKHVSEMSLRFELARTGDTLYVARTVTEGIGGILFIKRKFHVETEISELRPTAEAGGGTPRP